MSLQAIYGATILGAMMLSCVPGLAQNTPPGGVPERPVAGFMVIDGPPGGISEIKKKVKQVAKTKGPGGTDSGLQEAIANKPPPGISK